MDALKGLHSSRDVKCSVVESDVFNPEVSSENSAYSKAYTEWHHYKNLYRVDDPNTLGRLEMTDEEVSELRSAKCNANADLVTSDKVKEYL